MAPRKKTGVKDFYAQSKKNTSQRKKSGVPLKSQVRITSTEGRGDSIPATVGSSVVQPAVLNAYGRTDHPDGIEEREEILRQFDMNLSYGPCLGVPRLERWERASKLGLNPPKKIKELLENAGGMPDCLWEGLV